VVSLNSFGDRRPSLWCSEATPASSGRLRRYLPISGEFPTKSGNFDGCCGFFRRLFEFSADFWGVLRCLGRGLIVAGEIPASCLERRPLFGSQSVVVPEPG
jgi:hypothetical protein